MLLPWSACGCSMTGPADSQGAAGGSASGALSTGASAGAATAFPAKAPLSGVEGAGPADKSAIALVGEAKCDREAR